MASPESFDHIIIGTGQAFGTLLGRLLREGQRVAVIEKDRVGGTCVNTGCTPTKALVAAARAAWTVRNAGRWGVEARFGGVNYPNVHARMHAIREDSRQGLVEWMRSESDAELIRGHARFIDPKMLRVGERTVTADTIHIDTGSRPRIPEIPGLDTVGWMDNRALLALDMLPEHLLIVGGGPVGVEFAQIFRRFGSRVTLLQRESRVLGKEDEGIASAVQDILTSEEVRIECGVGVTGVSNRSDGGITLSFRRGDESGGTVAGSHVLLAAGRIPNTDDLGLDEAGIETDERGYIRVDDVCRTNVEGVYALGDVNGYGAFTHTAVNDAEIVLDHLFDGSRTLSARIPTYAVFTDPPLGRVGMTEHEARAAGNPFRMATRSMERFARAKEMGETRGFAKILVDEDTDRFLGAAVLGPRGDEVVGLITLAMNAGISCSEFRKTVLIHPTIAEILPWMLDDLESTEIH